MADTGRRAFGRWRAWLALPWLLACGTAAALSNDGNIRDLRHTAWGAKEGAPDAVAAMAQTSDGYLWLGGPGGLSRFDGLRFERIDLPRSERVSSANIFSLFAPASGGLWIGFSFGGVAFLKDGDLTAYTEAEGLPPGSVKAVAQDNEGVVWAGTTTGLARLDGSRWRKVGAESRYSDSQTEALLLDSAGTLWAASKNAVLFLPRGDAAFRDTGVPPDSSNASDVGLAESPDGTIWVYRDEGARQLSRNKNLTRRAAASNKGALVDRDGNLWTGSTGHALVRLPADRLDSPFLPTSSASLDMFTENDGLTRLRGSGAMMEDREGNVWTASGTGIDQFSERNVASVQPFQKGQDGDFTAYTASFAAKENGRVLVAGRTFASFELQGDRVFRHEDFGLVSSALRADDGVVWLGSTKGLCRHTAGRLDCVPLPAGRGEFDVQAMAQDRSGALWVSIVRNGVFRLVNGQWTAYGGIASLPKLTAIILASDAKGRIWFGYTEGRVAVLDDDKVTFFADASRLPVGNVTALYGKRGKVWVGGDFGLAEFNGVGFRVVTPKVGTSFNSLTGIVETAAGDLWLNGSSGIVHVTASEISRSREESSRVRGETFDANDGLQGSSARLRPLPTAIEGTDGRLWFARTIGLYSIDPARLHRNPVPPPVLIQSVNIGDKAYAPSEGLTLPQRTTSLRIDYVGLSLTMAERVRYRYKLDGVDADWQDVQTRRQAFYSNLAPGSHRFRVVAANNDGVWNEAGASVDFVIPPTFFQTGWFIALCAAGVVLLVWTAAWLRVRQVAARMRGRFAERMAERERIARELHDTLLQSTQGLILRFQAVANRITPDDPNRDMLNEALERADGVLTEGRDRVFDLRVSADPSGDLPEAFTATGEEFAHGRPVTFHSVVEGAPRNLQPVAKDEIYRIGREALLNAFRHARARSIELQIIYADEDLRLRIRDDGTGIDVATIQAGRPGHWGLQGMRERARRIGATLDVWSRPGAGTEIELKIPAAAAYAKPASRARRLPFRLTAGDRQ